MYVLRDPLDVDIEFVRPVTEQGKEIVAVGAAVSRQVVFPAARAQGFENQSLEFLVFH